MAVTLEMLLLEPQVLSMQRVFFEPLTQKDAELSEGTRRKIVV